MSAHTLLVQSNFIQCLDILLNPNLDTNNFLCTPNNATSEKNIQFFKPNPNRIFGEGGRKIIKFLVHSTSVFRHELLSNENTIKTCQHIINTLSLERHSEFHPPPPQKKKKKKKKKTNKNRQSKIRKKTSPGVCQKIYSFGEAQR